MDASFVGALGWNFSRFGNLLHKEQMHEIASCLFRASYALFGMSWQDMVPVHADVKLDPLLVVLYLKLTCMIPWTPLAYVP